MIRIPISEDGKSFITIDKVTDDTITCEGDDCFNPAKYFIEGFHYCIDCAKEVLFIMGAQATEFDKL